MINETIQKPNIMKTKKIQISEYGIDPISVCVTVDKNHDLNEVTEFIRDNYSDHEKLEYIEENDFHVNQECGGYTYIFHKK